MLRLACVVLALVTTACAAKAKKPATPADPPATEATPGAGSAEPGTTAPNADAPAEEGGTMRGDPCDGGE